jgi:hypothetical protein
MCESDSTTCPYCGDVMALRRKQCGKPKCKRAFNRERMRKFNAEHTGYYSKYDTANCYEHACPVCGKTFKNHKRQNPCHCSIKCWHEGREERQRQKLLPIVHPNPTPTAAKHALLLTMRGEQTSQTGRWFAGKCQRCQKPIVAKWRIRDAMFCSDRCARATLEHRRRMRKRGINHLPYSRVAIFERDGWRCHICGRKVKRNVNPTHALAPTIDHLIPLSKGGYDAPDNVACAHFLCNSIKSDTGSAQLILVD